jgi:hypothetical protein
MVLRGIGLASMADGAILPPVGAAESHGRQQGD